MSYSSNKDIVSATENKKPYPTKSEIQINLKNSLLSIINLKA